MTLTDGAIYPIVSGGHSCERRLQTWVLEVCWRALLVAYLCKFYNNFIYDT